MNPDLYRSILKEDEDDEEMPQQTLMPKKATITGVVPQQIFPQEGIKVNKDIQLQPEPTTYDTKKGMPFATDYLQYKFDFGETTDERLTRLYPDFLFKKVYSLVFLNDKHLNGCEPSLKDYLKIICQLYRCDYKVGCERNSLNKIEDITFLDKDRIVKRIDKDTYKNCFSNK